MLYFKLITTVFPVFFSSCYIEKDPTCEFCQNDSVAAKLRYVWQKNSERKNGVV